MDSSRNYFVNDADLIKGCIRGEPRMQTLLYQRFASKMNGVCLRYAGSKEEAEDILQEGFIKVFKGIASYRGDGSFDGWVRRIFVNTAIEHFRKKNHLQPLTEREENTIENNDLTVLETLDAKDLVKLIQTLPPGYRAVFNLYFVDEYTHKEIGKLLGISEGTSKSQYARAKAQLRERVTNNMEKRKRIP